MTEPVIRPFIRAEHRTDVLGQLARDYHERISAEVEDLIIRGIDDAAEKKDGKDGSKDAGEAGLFDKKDGGSKDGSSKDGSSKDGSKDDSKEGKDGSKDGGKEGKEGKEGKDEGKDGGKDSSDKGKDVSDKGGEKESSDKGDDKESGGGENSIFRYGQEIVLPVENLDLISELHSVRMASLLNQPIF